MKLLHLYFEGPLMSFGAPAVDEVRPAGQFPTRSMVTGLLANALGWRHHQFERLQALQDALRVAARADRPGEPLRDFQTVDIKQDHMLRGWTTWGAVEGRSSTSKKRTHIREVHYWADAIFLVVISLAEESPVTVEQAGQALRDPARPLFLGRKCCLPSAPLRPSLFEAEGLAAALEELPRHLRARQHGPLQAWCPADDPTIPSERVWELALPTLRDWRNRVHLGRENIAHFLVGPPEEETSHE